MKFSNKLYDILKWVCLVAIPALCTFLGVLLPAVDVSADITTKVITIIAAIGAFIGTLIGISTASYNNEINLKKEEQTWLANLLVRKRAVAKAAVSN